MNYFVILVITFCGISCNSQQKALESRVDTEKYYVYQIDSIDNYFLIYTKKEDTIFKIVSKKEALKKCDLVKINNSYHFDLYSQSSVPLITGEIIAPVSIYDVVCHTFENGTKICTDRKSGIYDLYYARNLKGLCIEEIVPNQESECVEELK